MQRSPYSPTNRSTNRYQRTPPGHGVLNHRSPANNGTTTPNTSHSHRNVNNQLMNNGGYASRVLVDDIMSSQGVLKEEVFRSNKTVTAVRQENIMLAEKVQHATNLYRQLLGMSLYQESLLFLHFQGYLNFNEGIHLETVVQKPISLIIGLNKFNPT